MTAAWLAAARRLGPVDAIVIGSDPAFSPTVALGLRRLHPRAALVHWCFDLYPEAITAEGQQRVATVLAPPARRLMRQAYRAYDQLVDIGPRMQERLRDYGAPAAQETLVPWALSEAEQPAPVDEAVRATLFPRARLALLYAGTMGRAHDFAAFLRLARACRALAGDAIGFCFAARGNRHDELVAALAPDDHNVTLAPFADEAALPARLAAADVHLVSLRDDWAGVVVPSKFFASLAIGRPVVYAGPGDSELARWIERHDLGLTLEERRARPSAGSRRAWSRGRRSGESRALAEQRPRRLPPRMVEAGHERSLEHPAPLAGRRAKRRGARAPVSAPGIYSVVSSISWPPTL